MAEAWRKVGDHEWWLLFEEAPDPVRGDDGKWYAAKDERGVTWPPSMVASWIEGDWTCVHLYSYSNGEEPAMPDADPDYLHICDLDEHIAHMQALNALTQATQKGKAPDA